MTNTNAEATPTIDEQLKVVTPSARAQREVPANPPPSVVPGFALRGVYTNQLLDAANPLFGLSHALYRYDKHIDVARLRKEVGNQINTIMEEVRQLPGMTQTLYSQLLPEITLWSDLDRPDPAFASPLMRKALNLPRQNAEGADPGEVLVVDSRAERPGGYQARLQVTVLLSPSEDSAQPYRVLRWQE